jgi:hypothetical protein
LGARNSAQVVDEGRGRRGYFLGDARETVLLLYYEKTAGDAVGRHRGGVMDIGGVT